MASPGLTNLIAYWSMDETSGVRADSFGSKDLSDGNTVLYGAGVISNAALFESANLEYLLLGDDSDFDLDVGSVSMWVKGTTLLNASIIDKLPWTAGSNGWRINSRANGDVWIQYGSAAGTSEYAVGSSFYNTSTFTHIVATWNGTTLAIIKNDGTPATASCTRTYTATGISLALGRNVEQAMEYWNGLTDEVAVFNDVLTAEEITWLYNSGSGRSFSEFVVRLLYGGLSFSGSLSKKTSTSYAGVLTPSGIVTTSYLRHLILAGSLSLSGIVTTARGYARSFAGALTMSGTVAKKTKKAFAGALTFVGKVLALIFAPEKEEIYFPDMVESFEIEKNEEIFFPEMIETFDIRER